MAEEREDELHFTDFLNNSTEEEVSTDPVDLQPEAQELAAEPTVEDETALEDAPVAESVEPMGQPEPAPSEPEERPSFEGYLRQNGYELDDDVDPTSLYERAVAEIQSNREARSRIEALEAELEAARSQTPAPPAAQGLAPSGTPTPNIPPVPSQPPANETPEQKGERLFKELKAYDPDLRHYVELDERGMATPKTEFGPTAIEAAKQINAYERAATEQAQMIMRDPNALIRDNEDYISKLVEDRAQALIDSRLSSFEQAQKQAAEEQQKAAAEREYDAKIDAWHEENKSLFFKLGENGEPRTDPFDPSQVALTPTGKEFKRAFAEYQQQLPGADHLVLMNLAKEKAELLAPSAPAAPQAPQTPMQQKKQFVEQRQASVPSVPHQNQPPASIEEVAQTQPSMKFSDMVFQDPDNQETVAGW